MIPSWASRARRLRSPFGSRSMAANAAIVAAAFAISRVLGMVRETIIAARFGTGESYDAYVAAFRIPDLLFVMVMSGAFGSAFIPVFGGFLAREETERAWRLASALLTWTVIVLLVVAQLLFLVARPLVSEVIAPGMPSDAQDLAVELTRILLLSPLLLGLGAAAKGMLEAQEQFILPAIAPIVYNLGIILGAVALAPVMGIHGLAVGVLIGAAGHAGFQLRWLVRRQVRLRPVLDLRIEGLGQVARLAVPRVAGQAVGQLNLVVVTAVASGVGAGAISALEYGRHLILLPHGILAMSLATVIFPRMARQIGVGDVSAFRDTMLDALRPLTFLTLPAVITLVTLREGIVNVVYQYGTFTPESAALVSDAVLWLAPGLLARSLIEPLTRGLYATLDTVTPLVVAAMAVVVNAVLAKVLAEQSGLNGIAFSLSITYTVRMLALLAVLSRRSGALALPWIASTSRMLPALAVLLVACAMLAGPVASVTDPAGGRSLWGYVAFGMALGTAGLVYLGSALLFRVPEARKLFHRLYQRVRRAPGNLCT